jgi:hypothetical protein
VEFLYFIAGRKTPFAGRNILRRSSFQPAFSTPIAARNQLSLRPAMDHAGNFSEEF